MSDPVATIEHTWGPDAPDWVKCLANECAASSQRQVAAKLDRSGALVNQVLKNKYNGDLGAVEDCVRGVFMNGTIDCPALGAIPSHECHNWRKKSRQPAQNNMLRVDLDRDGDVDARDVRAITRDQAVQIFIRYYFEKPRINLLPEPLQASVFDMYVNAGSNAVKILQRLLAEFKEWVTVDGVLGPKTAAAVSRAYKKAGSYLVDAYGIARRNYYFGLADGRAASRKYARTRAGGKGGWIKRAEEFISPRFHMTDAEFQRRVSTWA